MSTNEHTHIIKAGDFKTHCLEIMDKVNRDRDVYVITKRGVPVAKLIPISGSPPIESPFGYMKDTVIYMEDIIEPLGIKWEAEDGKDPS